MLRKFTTDTPASIVHNFRKNNFINFLLMHMSKDNRRRTILSTRPENNILFQKGVCNLHTPLPLDYH